ncbi:hypothetical protein B0H66DRAFT_443815, partial [Apodospora peruviana]
MAYRQLPVAARTLLRSLQHAQSSGSRTTTITSACQLQQRSYTRPTSRLLYAVSNKDDPDDRNTLKPRRSEGTKSGNDDDVAHINGAFNPTETKPEDEMNSARDPEGGSVLDASGGNQGFSKPQGDNPGEG